MIKRRENEGGKAFFVFFFFWKTLYFDQSGERNKTKYSFNENIGINIGSMLEINRAGSTAFTSQIAFGQ